MKQINLQDYTIVVDHDLSDLNRWLSKQNYSKFYVLVDQVTDIHCWPTFVVQCHSIEAEKFIVPSGEAHKNLHTCSLLWGALLNQNADRNALFINLGGGVVGDMGGFVASCYKRGIDFINIPTTILSQVDASIGGKLGVDFKNGKNLVGLFKNPKRVHIAADFHKTLPDRQFWNGMAEVYKHALIGDPDQWEILKANGQWIKEDPVGGLFQSLMIKKRIVDKDPFEKGIRKALNFGHTIGHAVETFSLEEDNHPLMHGEAIAAGMIMEAFISVDKCGLAANVMEEIVATLKAHYSHYPIHQDSIAAIWAFMHLDKKNELNRVMSVLLNGIGQPALHVELSENDVKTAIDFYNACYS